MVFRTLEAGYLLGLSLPEPEPEAAGSTPSGDAAGGEPAASGPRHGHDHAGE
ncbi:hypothetical protein [Jiangella asiatica]|uniref:hypothetical protein n=1 Tax=Jiangella asiatica TaxID=2530372 RepID=UPI0013A5EB93|nr:hypothetical protein [Jiangella asiatica]